VNRVKVTSKRLALVIALVTAVQASAATMPDVLPQVGR
jgi:hypothetical protein